MRRVVRLAVVAALVLPCLSQSRLYLVAGSIILGESRYCPTRLYVAQADDSVSLVREVLPARDRLIDLRDDLHGTLYTIGAPQWTETRELSMVHAADPAAPDTIRLTKDEGGGDFMFAGGAAGPGRPPAAVIGNSGHLGTPTPDVLLIWADPAARPRTEVTNWGVYRWFQYGGQVNGPFKDDGLGATMHQGRAYLWHPGGDLYFGDLGPAPPGAGPDQLYDLLADNESYFVVWPIPGKMLHGLGSGDVATALMARLDGVEVLEKRSGVWVRVDLPMYANVTFSGCTVRIFGDWLVTVETVPSTSQSVGKGWEALRSENVWDPRSNRTDQRALLPSLDQYGARFYRLYLPGKIEMLNLADGRKITLDTEQMDSEVLAISSKGDVLYRSYDKVFGASIEGTRMTAGKLLAQGDDVPEVHWAFWSSAPVPAPAARAKADGGSLWR